MRREAGRARGVMRELSLNVSFGRYPAGLSS